MIEFWPRLSGSPALLLHAEQVLGRGGVLVVVLGGRPPLLHPLHHSEVSLRELLSEATPERQFNRLKIGPILILGPFLYPLYKDGLKNGP